MAIKDPLARIADDVEAIKKLVIFSMIQNGASQSKIAAAIGTSQASISRMFAKSDVKE